MWHYRSVLAAAASISCLGADSVWAQCASSCKPEECAQLCQSIYQDAGGNRRSCCWGPATASDPNCLPKVGGRIDIKFRDFSRWATELADCESPKNTDADGSFTIYFGVWATGAGCESPSSPPTNFGDIGPQGVGGGNFTAMFKQCVDRVEHPLICDLNGPGSAPTCNLGQIPVCIKVHDTNQGAIAGLADQSGVMNLSIGGWIFGNCQDQKSGSGEEECSYWQWNHRERQSASCFEYHYEYESNYFKVAPCFPDCYIDCTYSVSITMYVYPGDTACCEPCCRDQEPPVQECLQDEVVISDPRDPEEPEEPIQDGGGGGGDDCGGGGGGGGGSGGGNGNRNGSVPGPGGGQGDVACTMDVPSSSCSPVALAEGFKHERVTDVSVAITGTDFALTRVYNSRPTYNGSALVGNNWTLSGFRYLTVHSGGSEVRLHESGAAGYVKLNTVSTGLWKASGPTTQQLVQSTTSVGSATIDTWMLEEPGNWKLHFYRAGGTSPAPNIAKLEGLPIRSADPYGNGALWEYGLFGLNQVARCTRILLNGDTEATAKALVSLDWYPASLASGGLSGKLRRIVVMRLQGTQQVTTNEVSYEYLAADDTSSAKLGRAGDLVEVVKRVRVDRVAGGAEQFYTTVTQYRYHDGSTPGSSTDERLTVQGADHQLRLVIEPQQIEHFAASSVAGMTTFTMSPVQAASTLRTMADSATWTDQLNGGVTLKLVDLASKIVGYETGTSSERRVTKQYLSAGCACSAGAQGLKLSYTYNINADTNPSVKIKEYMTTGTGTYDTNAFRWTYFDLKKNWSNSTTPYLTTVAIVEGPEPSSLRRWVWHYEYNATTRLIERAYTPSSCSSYTAFDDGSGNQPAFVGHTNQGLVYTYTHNGQRRLTEVKLGQGDVSTGQKLISRTTYSSSTGLESLVTKIERFSDSVLQSPTSNPEKVETTNFAYGYHTGTSPSDLKIAWVETTVEAEAESENGPSTSSGYVSVELLDITGRSVWSKAADGAVTYRVYDGDTGALVQLSRNAPLNGAVSGVPALVAASYGGVSTTGWGRYVSTGDCLTTTWTVDALGRTRTRVGPDGIRTDTRRMVLRPVHKAASLLPRYTELSFSWRDTDTGSGITPIYSGPASLTSSNAGMQTIASWEQAMPGALSLATQFDPDNDVVLLSNKYFNVRHMDRKVSGVVAQTRVYPATSHSHIPTDWPDPYVTAFAYDQIGRMQAVTSPTGTVSVNSKYDVLDRVLEVKVGTGTANAEVVAEYFYDHTGSVSSPSQGVGNGNLTLVKEHTGESSSGLSSGTPRATVREYDFRDRPIKVKRPLPPHEVVVYDNLNRMIERGVFSTDPTSGIGSSDRGLYSKSLYSQRGLLYKQQVAVNPATPTTYLETNRWFDANGRVVAASSPNAPGTKTEYDGLGRAVASYVTDRAGDPAPGATGNYVAAISLTGDHVIEQSAIRFNEKGQAEVVTSFQRLHDDTMTTGALTTSNAVATFQGMRYDDVGRRWKTIDFGSNLPSPSDDFLGTGGSAPSAGTIASPPSHALESSMTYDERSLPLVITDPKNNDTKLFHDDLDRRIGVIENWDDGALTWTADSTGITLTTTDIGDPSVGAPSIDRLTRFEYDAGSRVSSQIAYLASYNGSAVTIDMQATTYNYGVTATLSTPAVTDSLVHSEDLLAQVTYPNDGGTGPFTVSYSYNRVGELRSVTDQNGTVHAYERDELGRVNADRVDTLGTSVSGLTLDGSVRSIRVDFDNFGRLDTVKSHSGTASTTPIVNAVKFAYTDLWQIASLLQDVDGDVGVATGLPTRTVGYTYSNGASNHSRLTGLVYPSGATIDFGYAGINDTISRVNTLTRTTSAATTDIAEYWHLGMGTFAITDYGGVGTSTLGSVQLDRTLSIDGKRRYGTYTSQAAGQYHSFDRFGRVKFHAWADGALNYNGSTGRPDRPFIVAETYAYDKASNRTEKRDARHDLDWPFRDKKYSYDGLDRLIEAERGAFAGTTFTAEKNSEKWDLDSLGNWTAFNKDLDGGGTYGQTTDLLDTRTHNPANELSQRVVVDPSNPSPGVTLPFTYDAAGNMATQQMSGPLTRKYRHDAWNRLTEVIHNDGTNPDFVIARHQYNGLHWRTQSLADVRDVQTSPGSMTERRAMYYDASWRAIHEEVDDAYSATGGGSGGPTSPTRVEEQVWGQRYIDDAVTRIRGAITAIGTDTTGPTVNWAAAGRAGLELQLWQLSDIQFSVVAVLSNASEVLERVEYSPYGVAKHMYGVDFDGDGVYENTDFSPDFLDAWFAGKQTTDWDRDGVLSSADIFGFLNAWFAVSGQPIAGSITASNRADNPIGYCGYRFCRETQEYSVRFRWFSPRVGRWLERDPIGHDLRRLNLYEYMSGMTLSRGDPSGLDPKIEPKLPYSLGDSVCIKQLQDAIRRLCPKAVLRTSNGRDVIKITKHPDSGKERAEVNALPGSGIIIDEKAKNPDFKDTPECQNGPGCDLIRKLASSSKQPPFRIADNGTNIYHKGIVNWNCTTKVPIETVDGKKRDAEPWETFWHEMVHAGHDADGELNKWGDSEQQKKLWEEVRTIDKTNEFNAWYNKCAKCADKEPVSDRDPFSHSVWTRKLRELQRPWIQK